MIETPANLNETHFPRSIFDGLEHRIICTCGFMTPWRREKSAVELMWGEHGVKTIQKNIQRRSFRIIGNPLAQGSEN
jgi:hypothetical protein